MRGKVDDLDLFRATEEAVGDGLALRDPGDLLDNIVEGFDVLDVEGGHHVDPRGEELFDVLPPFVVLRARRVGVRELVDKRDLGATIQHRLQVHLLERDAAMFDTCARDGRDSRSHRRRCGAAVSLYNPDDDIVPAPEEASPIFQHGEGLADAGGSAEQHPKLPPFRHDQPSNSSSARFSSRTFTLDSPKDPASGPWV